jgi:LysR family transcriptional activator of nhaA
MDELNYHHLRHFWAVAREGGVTRAAERLHVSQPTVTAHVRQLEEALGEKLLARAGRGVVLTEVGRAVYRQADELFTLSREVFDTAKGRPSARPVRLAVGIAMVVPKLVAYRILEPALRLPEPVRLECLEDAPERLLSELAAYGLDLVLTDAPMSPTIKVKAFSHLLGECGVSILGVKALAASHRRGFPRSLDGAPFLLTRDDSELRRSLELWFDEERVHPKIVAEFEDNALLKVFGEEGAGLFAAPTAIEAEVCRKYNVQLVGRLESVRERFYVITVERKIRHPAVVAISDAAHKKLFA